MCRSIKEKMTRKSDRWLEVFLLPERPPRRLHSPTLEGFLFGLLLALILWAILIAMVVLAWRLF